MSPRAFAAAALCVLAHALLGAPLAAADPPPGWFLAGSAPKAYESGLDRSLVHGGKASAVLRSRSAPTGGFGTLMQIFRADAFKKKRVRLSGYLKSDKVAAWAGLWMRIDSTQGEPLAFDNMQDRPIRGTTGWTKIDVVLDVAPGAAAIAIGVLLDETGAVWVDDLSFQVVDKTVPTTGAGPILPRAPDNLGFEK